MIKIFSAKALLLIKIYRALYTLPSCYIVDRMEWSNNCDKSENINILSAPSVSLKNFALKSTSLKLKWKSRKTSTKITDLFSKYFSH